MNVYTHAIQSAQDKAAQAMDDMVLHKKGETVKSS